MVTVVWAQSCMGTNVAEPKILTLFTHVKIKETHNNEFPYIVEFPYNYYFGSPHETF